MACGAPVIATSVDGNPEIVRHGQTGLLATSEDAASIATALRTLRGDPDLRNRLANQGRAWVIRRHDWAALAQQYLALGN
jgi:glycosyltransferase involved in cell wall biosynthesis